MLFHPLWTPGRAPCVISARARRVVVDWMVEVCFHLAPGADSLIHLAVHAVDMYLHKRVVPRKQFQLVCFLSSPLPLTTCPCVMPPPYHLSSPSVLCVSVSVSCVALCAVCARVCLQLGAASIIRALRTNNLHVENLTARMSKYTVRDPYFPPGVAWCGPSDCLLPPSQAHTCSPREIRDMFRELTDVLGPMRQNRRALAPVTANTCVPAPRLAAPAAVSHSLVSLDVILQGPVPGVSIGALLQCDGHPPATTSCPPLTRVQVAACLCLQGSAAQCAVRERRAVYAGCVPLPYCS